MNVPTKMGIWITQKCPLRCKFCENSNDYFKQGKIMSLDIFESKVKEVIEAGISYIDLTPIVGEVLLVPNFGDYLDILDSYKEIEKYTFITCLIGSKQNIDALRGRPKLELEISLYGLSSDEYKERTNKDTFNTFIKNFKYLVQTFDNSIVIINRTSDPNTKLLKRDMPFILQFLLKKCHIDEQWVDDRSNYTEVMKEKNVEKFRCHFMTEPLLVEDGICFCCMDWNRKNVSKNKITELYDEKNFNEKIKENGICNKKCGWYRPLNV